MSSAIRGFILQPTYRIESGRPVVHLWGRLETGETFLVRDDRRRPHFYIRELDVDRSRALELGSLYAVQSRSLAGEEVVRVEVPLPADTPPIRERLHEAGIPTFEADIRFAIRFLIDHGIRGSLAIQGESQPGQTVDRIFINPDLAPAAWKPNLEVLSIDIETDPRARRILSIGLYGCDTSEVLLLTPNKEEVPPEAIPLATEAELLVELRRRVARLDPDVLTGWNVAGFDFAVLIRRAEELGVDFSLGRGNGQTRLRPGRSFREATQVLIPGRLVLDGLALLRGAFIRMERHALDYVARQVLGEGKTLAGGRNKAAEILRLFREDRTKFVEYNLTDARLVINILDKLALIDLAIERSLLTGMPLDRVSSSIAAFDFLYLTQLGRRQIVAPSVRRIAETQQATSGGYVLEPEPGLYDNVAVLDFKSLYPSLIRTFHIDPLGYVAEPDSEAEVIRSPNGTAFRRDAGILTLLLDELLPRREAAKKEGNEVESFAIKILMNSFFGVLATPVCRFYNPAVANAITKSGRILLLWSKHQLESWGHRVLYGDTDSLFVETGEAEARRAQQLAEKLVERLNSELADYIRQQWSVDSRLEVELEKLFHRLFLPRVRHGSGGARKRYAGLVEHAGEPEVVLTGLEAVRRDWTSLAREAQRELYRRFFLDLPIEGYLLGLVKALRAGELDHLLVYRKALRKDLDSYTATTPPHVAAARKLSGRPGQLISYVITAGGAEPVEEQRSPIDYQHYLDKQLLPISEPILDQLGLRFARVVGDDRQMDLF